MPPLSMALEALMVSDQVKHIGVSSFSVGQLREALGSTEKYSILSNQVLYTQGFAWGCVSGGPPQDSLTPFPNSGRHASAHRLPILFTFDDSMLVS